MMLVKDFFERFIVSRRGALLGTSILEWAGLLLFVFLAIVFFAVFSPPKDPQVNFRIVGASAGFELQGNMLSILRSPVVFNQSGEVIGDILAFDPDGVSAVISERMAAVYPDSAWFVRLYPVKGADLLAFADLHGGKPFIEVASRSRVPFKDGVFVGCADLNVDALLGDPVKLGNLAPLALSEIVVPSPDGIMRVISCEVRPR